MGDGLRFPDETFFMSDRLTTTRSDHIISTPWKVVSFSMKLFSCPAADPRSAPIT
jgi:hypothetical protein